jgi:hypothetical protein
MRITPRLGALVAACAIACASVSLVGCGESGGAQSANIKPENMPEGQQWTGVYFNPVFGYLHVVQNDNDIVGRWKRADQSAWGELSGVATGNVMHFTWKEHKYGLVGPAADAKGKGYFVYKVNSDKTGELDGEYGIGDDETGGSWHNVKQTNKQPDLNSIKGDMQGTAPPASKDSWQ